MSEIPVPPSEILSTNDGPPEEIQVTIVKELHEMRFLHPNGSEVHPPKEWQNADSAISLGQDLAELYITLGEGEHTRKEAQERTGMRSQKIVSVLRALEGAMPPQIFGVNNEEKTFSFGTFSVASKVMTEEEKAAIPQQNTRQKERAAARTQAQFEKHKAELLEADERKRDLTQHDHAQVRIADETFQLPLASPHAFLAARVFDWLLRRPVNAVSECTLGEVTSAVWREMPIVERELFAKTEKQIYGPHSRAFKDQINGVLTDLTSRLRLTRRGTVGEQFLLQRHTKVQDVEYRLTPPPVSYGLEVRKLFPPGTDREMLTQLSVDERELTPEEIAEARWLVQEVYSSTGRGLSQPETIKVLDTIMDLHGKRSLEAVLEESAHPITLQDVLRNLHRKVKVTLGEYAYSEARRARVIHRKGTGRAYEPSAGLPATTKWYIQKPEGQ